MYYKQELDVDVFLPVEAGKKMKAPVEFVDKTFTMRYKPVYHFNFGLIGKDGVKQAPTLVVFNGEEFEKYRGVSDIKGWLMKK